VERLERLVNMVVALLDSDRPLTREELRARVGGYAGDAEAFRRNFERDKDLLRRMGIPLELEPLDPLRPEASAGYRVRRERYELPDPGLAADELAALRLAAAAVELQEAWGREAATSALWKLAAATPGDEPPGPAGTSPAPAKRPAPARPGPSAALAELPGGDELATLFGAAATGQRVRFTYHGADRQVDPWRLSYRAGQWYLTGWDHGRRASRTFRLDRLEGHPEPVGAPGAFVRPAGADTTPPPWQLGDDPETVARVLVDDDQAEWATAAVGEAAVTERRSDGAVVLELAVTNTAALRTFVLGFLDHAEILGPPALRDAMIDWLAATAEAG
jgi:predicted DNA-binding transcriptional regulator YafY